MKEKDINMLMKKAEEMRALFVLGQSIIPFMEEIFLFVKEVHPLLNEINVSIEDNLKKMPKAAKHLSKVTQATENATTEILDTVEGVVSKADLLQLNILQMQNIFSQKKNVDEDTLNEHTEFASNSYDVINSIRTDASNIMMALQVQDITSQQIAAVNHMLEAVQSRLGSLLERFSNANLMDLISEEPEPAHHENPTNVTMLHRAVAFDPEAVETLMQENESKQSEIDFLVKNNFYDTNILESPQIKNESELIYTDIETPQEYVDEGYQSGSFSQNDIDKLFNK